MRTIEIKEQEIVYKNIKNVNFFENEQKLAITDRVYGVNKTVLFDLKVDEKFKNQKTLEIKYQYFTSEGEVKIDEIDNINLELFLNDDLDMQKIHPRHHTVFYFIKYAVLGFLNSNNPKFENWFITSTSYLNELVEDSLYNSKRNYQRMFNIEDNHKFPLMKFYQKYIYVHLYNNGIKRDYENDTLTFEGKVFKSDEEILEYIHPNLKDFNIDDIKDLKQKLFNIGKYESLYELDILIGLIENEEHNLKLNESIVLNELLKEVE